MCYLYAIEYYSDIKRNEVHASKQINLENFMTSGRSHS